MSLYRLLSGCQTNDLIRSRLFVLLVIFVVALSLLRLSELDRDPYYQALPFDTGFAVDEGYKTLSAVNLAEFDAIKWTDGDSYEGWYGRSFLTQAFYWVAFKAFGPTLESARLCVGLLFLTFVICGAYIFVRKLSAAAAAAFCVMALTEPLALYFCRTALFEVWLGIFLASALLGVIFYIDSPGKALLTCSGFAVVSQFLIKPSAIIYFLPLWLTILGYWLWQRGLVHRWRDYRWLILGLLAALSSVAGYVFLHLGRYSYVPGEFSIFSLAIKYFTNPLFISSSLFVATLALMMLMVVAAPRKMTKMDIPLAAVGLTLSLGPLFISLASYAPPRYFAAFTSLLPVAMGLCVHISTSLKPEGVKAESYFSNWRYLSIFILGLIFLWAGMNALFLALIPVAKAIGIDDPSQHGLVKYLLLPVASVAAVMSLYWRRMGLFRYFSMLRPFGLSILLMAGCALAGSYQLAIVLSASTEERAAVATRIRELTEPSAVIVGDWAPMLVLDSGRRAIYMNDIYNNASQISTVNPNYFVYSGSKFDVRSREVLCSNGGEFKCTNEVVIGAYAGHQITLIALSPNG